MKRRETVYYLTLAMATLSTGGVAALASRTTSRLVISQEETELLNCFRAQLASYPAITQDALFSLAEPVRILERRPGGLKFMNVCQATVDLSFRNGHLRATTY